MTEPDDKTTEAIDQLAAFLERRRAFSHAPTQYSSRIRHYTDYEVLEGIARRFAAGWEPDDGPEDGPPRWLGPLSCEQHGTRVLEPVDMTPLEVQWLENNGYLFKGHLPENQARLMLRSGWHHVVIDGDHMWERRLWLRTVTDAAGNKTDEFAPLEHKPISPGLVAWFNEHGWPDKVWRNPYLPRWRTPNGDEVVTDPRLYLDFLHQTRTDAADRSSTTRGISDG